MIKKGLILGTDNILCSTVEFHRQAWKIVMLANGIDFSPLKELDLAILGREECLDCLLSLTGTELSAAEKKVLVAEKNEQYRQLLSGLDTRDLMPGIKELLNDLKKKHWRLCFISSSKNAVLLLRQLELVDAFDSICDGNDTFIRMGLTDKYKRACELMDIKPAECVIWENNEKRAEAAENTGIRTVRGTIDEVRKYLYSIEPLQE